MTGEEGVFLKLFHGTILPEDGIRDDAKEMTFGPFEFIHGDRERVVLQSNLEGEKTLFMEGERVFYARALYSSWLIFQGRPEEVMEFEEEKALPRRRSDDF
jgi:hypothetical protein